MNPFLNQLLGMTVFGWFPLVGLLMHLVLTVVYLLRSGSALLAQSISLAVGHLWMFCALGRYLALEVMFSRSLTPQAIKAFVYTFPLLVVTIIFLMVLRSFVAHSRQSRQARTVLAWSFAASLPSVMFSAIGFFIGHTSSS